MATPNNIVEIVQSWVGNSLINYKEDLAMLIARGVDDPNKVVQIKTNCATFTLGVWWFAGVQHPLLNTKYKIGMAVAWCRQIAIDLHALRKYPQDGLPVPGSSLHYYTPGYNNNHLEFLLETPNKNKARHAGGGRHNNAIMSDTGDITVSSGRRLQEWIDPVALLVGAPDFHW